jgi:hypothetical protein
MWVTFFQGIVPRSVTHHSALSVTYLAGSNHQALSVSQAFASVTAGSHPLLPFAIYGLELYCVAIFAR